MKSWATTLGGLPNEAICVAAAKIDPAAFAAIYDHYFAAVYNYVRYRLSDPVSADDVTAQIFEKVLISLPRYDAAHGQFAVWLFAIARNTVNDQLRVLRRRKWLSLERLHNRSSGTPQPEERVLQQEQYEALALALEQLTDRERDLLALKFAAQLSNRKLAELTGLTEANVAVILFRALKRLRSHLQSDQADHE
jgi:RNA polymerase sigma-70 factor, ECF subfamily